jgi:hypothetical protein
MAHTALKYLYTHYIALIIKLRPYDHSEPVYFKTGDNISVHLRFLTILDALTLLHSV